ncbi:MAG: hypothetical protein J6O71_06870 [Lachnospiraceae bacterium]|nr:hypothetical protein [Lachnospiraceae bacterium]
MGAEDQEEEGRVNENLMEFLDAETFDERLEVLRRIRTTIDDRTIDAIAVAIDTEIPAGSVEERYDKLLEHMQMKKKYEYPGRR